MLHLASTTDRDWVARAVAHLDEVLLDHAHLEKKAASTAVNLIFRYPDQVVLMQPLSALAREELEHFERMLEVLHARGVAFKRQRPSAYAGRLMTAVRPSEPHRLLDTLLCCALIEARSCERMRLLADGLEAAEEGALAEVYRSLLASEARHHVLYVELAEAIFAKDEVAARLDEIARHEAEQLAEAPPESRLHG